MFPVRNVAVALPLIAILASVGSAVAASQGVVDEGKLFSPGAIDKANERIREIARDYGRDLLIDTVPGIPSDLESKYTEQGKSKFFNAWAEQRASAAQVKGIYMLLSKQPGHLQIEVDKATRQKAFTTEDRDLLVQKMLPLLRDKKNDEALGTAVDFIASTIQRHGGRTTAAGAGAVSSRVSERQRPGQDLAKEHGLAPKQSILTWVLIGGGVILVIWLISGLFRSLSGGGGQAGAGGIGGGGGGFLTSIMGGLFGAAAGSWIYDSFFRHGSAGGSEAYGAETHGGSGDAGQEAGAGDFGGDSGGGGDFGGDSGGGDFGGGDFGGGDF